MASVLASNQASFINFAGEPVFNEEVSSLQPSRVLALARSSQAIFTNEKAGPFPSIASRALTRTQKTYEEAGQDRMKAMADCGSLIGEIATLQTQIDDDNAQLNDPNWCDGPTKQQCEALLDSLASDRDGATAQRDALQQQLPPVCSLLVGPRQVDAHGFDGQLTVETGDSESGQGLSGSMTVAGGPPDRIDGSWDDAAKFIQFILGGGNPITQDYTGFLGNNNAIILAGWFKE